MRVLISGANGFVGQALCGHLAAAGHGVVPVVRRASGMQHEVIGSNIDATTDWQAALTGCEAVVHLAARMKVIQDDAQDLLVLYRAVNTGGTLNLARQAADSGVQRFVFISSIKVNGEGCDLPYREDDPPAPQDAYAISKWEAEQGLRGIEMQTGMEVVILRPPLVYGPGVGANFLRLMQTVERGLPLPLGAIHNRRSLLYLGNFTDAIRLCIEHTAAAGQTFLLDDGKPVSSPELIRAVADAMHRPARLLPVPIGLLRLACRVTGKSAAVTRMAGSLYVDGHAIRQRLGWIAPYSMRDGLAATVAAFVLDRVSVRT